VSSASDLATTAWPQIADRPLVLVPVGSIEQHGPHLPLDTDTVIAEAVARRVADDLDGAWVAPAISYAASGEHEDFPGTSSIGLETLHLLVVELARSMSLWAGRIVFVNAHGGNVVALNRAVEQLVGEGHEVTWVPCAIEDADLHAGLTETSLMLHLRPDTVRLDRAEKGCTAPLGEILPALLQLGVRAVSSNGVLGDPDGASAEHGRHVLDLIVAHAGSRVGGS